jgi:tRNA1(Val) A37 N6-methylase TrmN6
VEITQDGFLGGRLTLAQPKDGYRAGIDPVLLAAACPAKQGEDVLELGCGVGVASLCLAARLPGVRLHGVEILPDYAQLARANAAQNKVEF